jgi:predicted DNA binding CopG/RHH family protein
MSHPRKEPSSKRLSRAANSKPSISSEAKTPEVGHYLDDEEQAFIESFEADFQPPEERLSDERRAELEAMARATMNEERAKISLRIPRRDLTLLKSRALQDGIPYQTLINALIRRFVNE